MRKILAGTAVLAMALTGAAAHAACMTANAATVASAPLILNHTGVPPHTSIVGTWQVVYPMGSAFIQWHADNTEWENINYPILGGNLCMGNWSQIDRYHYTRNHYGWLYSAGTVVGYFNETESDLLSLDGNSYTGTNSTTMFDLTGKITGGPFPGTAVGTRLWP